MTNIKEAFKAILSPAVMYCIVMTMSALMFGATVETYVLWGMVSGFFIMLKGYHTGRITNTVSGVFLILLTASAGLSYMFDFTLAFAAQPYAVSGISGASDWGSLMGPIAIAALAGAITGWIQDTFSDIFQAAKMVAPALAIIGAVGMILAGVKDYIATMEQFPLLSPLIPSGMQGTIWASAIFAGGGIFFYTIALTMAFTVAAAGMEVAGP